MATKITVLARASLTYSVADDQITHSPLLVASIGGAVARLVVDTGSEVHLLNEDMARSLGLDLLRGEVGTDHGGTTVPSWSAKGVELAVGDAYLTLREVVAIPAPEAFSQMGIAGILSPQHLIPAAMCVLDLRTSELFILDAADDALEDWLVRRHADLTLMRLTREPPLETIVIRAAVEPFAMVPTLLNTGGKRSEFAAAAVPGLGGSTPQRLGAGVTGASYEGALAGCQRLSVGGIRLAIPQLAIRHDTDDTQGIVGMDILSDTVLAFSDDPSRPVFWQVAPAITQS